jgi:hypothetical protein
MLKAHKRVKELEIKGLEAVRELLELIPILTIESIQHEHERVPDQGIDGLIRVRNADKTYAIAMQVKSQGQPRYVRSAIYQLRNYTVHVDQAHLGPNIDAIVPLLVAPYLSPEARAICADHHVAYVDLFGNFRLVFGTVFIERTVAEKPKSETKSLRSIFSPKASAVLRVILGEPNAAWRVTELAERAGVSLGHVSNVRKALLEREWIEEQEDGVVLTKPQELLETWQENYRRPTGQRITGYTHMHGQQLDDYMRNALICRDDQPRAICSLHSAAKWMSPFARDGMNSFYADDEGAHHLQHVLDLSPSSKGANVNIQIIKNESIFEDAVEPVPGIFCTSPIQTYLDLWVGNERDREAAQFLQEERLPWLM